MRSPFRRILKAVAPHAFEDGRARSTMHALSLIGDRGIGRMLDVGCGDGQITMQVARAAGTRTVCGAEYVHARCKSALSKGILCAQADLDGRWPFADESFDLVISSHNIEHVCNIRAYVEEMYRCLRSQGQAVILTENLSSWINIGALLFGWEQFSTANIGSWCVGNPLSWRREVEGDADFIEKHYASGVIGTVAGTRVLAHRGRHFALPQR